MKIVIGNDARGYELKEKLKHLLEVDYEIIDVGSNEDGVDYPLIAKKVGNVIQHKEADFGILICRTGIGMSIAANKINGIRCAKVSNKEEATLTRLDNDANVISIACDLENAYEIVLTFLQSETSLEERHVRRREEIEELEDDN